MRTYGDDDWRHTHTSRTSRYCVRALYNSTIVYSLYGRQIESYEIGDVNLYEIDLEKQNVNHEMNLS